MIYDLCLVVVSCRSLWGVWHGTSSISLADRQVLHSLWAHYLTNSVVPEKQKYIQMKSKLTYVKTGGSKSIYMTWYLKEYDLNDWRPWKDIISSELEVRMDLDLTLIPWNLIRHWDSAVCYYMPCHHWISLHHSCYSNGKPDITTKLCLSAPSE
jgi:hypothetical protein